MDLKELEREARQYYRGKLVLVEYFQPHPILVDEADPELQWFVFQVKPRAEIDAERRIQSLGFSAVVPKVFRRVRAHRYAKHRRVKRVPAFPGYVFVGFEPGPVPFRQVLDLGIVKGVIAPGGNPSRLNGKRFCKWISERRFDAGTVNELMKGREPINEVVPAQDRAA